MEQSSQTAKNSSFATRSIRVLLLRHGEREDETESYDKRQHSRRERVDPALTALGHRQALHAWENILACLPPNDDIKPVFVATSPLRRCVGTASMVAAAAAGKVRFGLPSTTSSDTTPDGSTIPILIMNGLGDCAAQMQSMGGIGKVVQGGWLQCAASPANDLAMASEEEEEGQAIKDSSSKSVWGFSRKKNSDAPKVSALQRSLHSICSTAVVVAKEDRKKQQKKASESDTDLESSIGNRNSTACTSGDQEIETEPKIQFWRESQGYHYHEPIPAEHLSPMTQAQTLQEHAMSVPNTSTKGTSARMPPNASSAEEEDFHRTLQRAVLHTYHAGLNTCILVTHREAIRFIEKKVIVRQSKRNSKHGTNATGMYCCVAVYKVTVEENSVLHWDSRAVVPYQLLQPHKMGVLEE